MLRLVLVLVFLYSANTQADAFTVPLPDNAERLKPETVQQGNLRIALGRVREVNSRWQFEKEKTIKGELRAATWQLDSNATYADTADYFINWVKQSDQELLYHCSGRACGASNLWANNYFEDWRLYGPDAKQYYWVLRDNSRYVLLYLIERGNRNVYLHIQYLIDEQQSQLPNSLVLNAQCQQPQLASLAKSALAKQWLLLASVAKDDHQVASIRAAEQCLLQLRTIWPEVDIHVLGLGGYDRHWQPVDKSQFELIQR